MGKSRALIYLFITLFLAACSPTKNSLLTDYVAKNPCADSTCLTRNAVESDLSIQPTLSTLAIKKGTTVAEIDGYCNPSFYSEHRIVVKVYPGSYASGTPMAENNSYIVSTNGSMLSDGGKVYPQCLRGRFSFLIPLFNPSNPAAVLTSVYTQFFIQANDPVKGDVFSPVGSNTVTILQ